MVLPGYPHHITQRGNRRQEVFFNEEDYVAYLAMMAEHCRKAGTPVWAYCLMPNHAHLVLVPREEDGLRQAIGEAHRRYTRRISFRHGWRGHLWQERFHSFPMDENHLLAAVRYIEQNPVRAGLCRSPEEWRWSSARAYLAGKDDGLVEVSPMLDLTGDWERYLSEEISDAMAKNLRLHARTGRPLGDKEFVEKAGRKLGRDLLRRKPGPRTGDS